MKSDQRMLLASAIFAAGIIIAASIIVVGPYFVAQLPTSKTQIQTIPTEKPTSVPTKEPVQIIIDTPTPTLTPTPTTQSYPSWCQSALSAWYNGGGLNAMSGIKGFLRSYPVCRGIGGASDFDPTPTPGKSFIPGPLQ